MTLNDGNYQDFMTGNENILIDRVDFELRNEKQSLEIHSVDILTIYQDYHVE
jgi:hypothetical protein